MLISLLLLAACPAWAGVITTTETEYYPVSGSTPQEIAKSIDTNSTVTKKGKTYAAVTRPQINVEYGWINDGRTCSINKVTVRVHILYRYPKLENPSLKKAYAKWWKKTLATLEQHELIHGAIAIQYAEMIQDKISMKSYICGNFEKKIRMNIQSILRKMRVKQDAYDGQTAHGLTQEKFTGISSIR